MKNLIETIQRLAAEAEYLGAEDLDVYADSLENNLSALVAAVRARSRDLRAKMDVEAARARRKIAESALWETESRERSAKKEKRAAGVALRQATNLLEDLRRSEIPEESADPLSTWHAEDDFSDDDASRRFPRETWAEDMARVQAKRDDIQKKDGAGGQGVDAIDLALGVINHIDPESGVPLPDRTFDRFDDILPGIQKGPR